MKKLFYILLTLLLCACNSSLPKPELAEGIRGSQLGIDKNINEETIDNYLNRKDAVYRDMRMLKDEANYEAIGGDSYLSGYIKGFEIVPYPYLCNVTGLPEEVGYSYTGTTLYTLNEDGTYSANYEESDEILESLFPKDKIIFLMCGGGGYAGMTKNLLVARGYDENKIYNVGGYWYYNGKNSISTKKEDGTYDFSNVPYHKIDFDSLTMVKGYDPNYQEKDKSDTTIETNIKEIRTLNTLENKINNKDTFLLLIYLNGCTSCASFKPIVEELANTTDIEIYSISLDVVKEFYPNIKFTPAFLIYKEGILLDYLDANKDEDIIYFENLYNLSSFVAKYLDIEISESDTTNNDTKCDSNSCSLTND